jgi:acetoin utilization protein AcuB
MNGGRELIVEEIMNRHVFTLKETDSVKKAISLINERKIRHIPIIDEHDQLLGIITDRDIKEALPSSFHLNNEEQILSKPVKEIMKKEIITIHPLDFVEEVAALFYEHKIGCLPVVKENKLVGIITQTDVLRTFVELTGSQQPSSQIEIKVPNRTGMLYEVASIFREKNINIQSVLVYPDKHNAQYKILVFRIQTMNPLSVIQTLKERNFNVLWPNTPGISS